MTSMIKPIFHVIAFCLDFNQKRQEKNILWFNFLYKHHSSYVYAMKPGEPQKHLIVNIDVFAPVMARDVLADDIFTMVYA